MANDNWFGYKTNHWRGPNLGNPIQGNLKELNAGTLEKKMNGKDLYYDLPEAISIGTKLRQCRGAPLCLLLVNLVSMRDCLVTTDVRVIHVVLRIFLCLFFSIIGGLLQVWI